MRYRTGDAWRWILAALTTIALGATVAACGSSDSGSNTASTPASGSSSSGSDTTKKVDQFAIVTPEKRDDFGWNAQGVQAAEQVAKDLGVKVDVADGSGYDNISPVLDQLANGGAKMVIAHASGYNTAAPDAAAQTGVPMLVWDNPKVMQKGLVGDAETDAGQGAYLAGVLAAKTTKTHTLGIVMSADDINWNKLAGGFVAGARSVDPGVKILLAQIGQAAYADAAGGKRVTQTVIAGGADVVLGMGDGSSFGMLQAVEQSGKAKFIDVIGDKTPIDKKGVLLSSILWDFSKIFQQAIEDVDNGTFGEKPYKLDTSNGISLLKTKLAGDQAWAAVEEAKTKLQGGGVDVPLTVKKSEVQALINSK
jgi:basic membrane protein A